MTEAFIEKAIKVHGDKYDYSKVEYKKSSLKVIIICKEHGDFEQTPNSHLCNKGCVKCGIMIRANLTRKDNIYFIEKAKLIHGDTYDYSKVNYINCNKKVIIICKIHGEFNQTPSNHKKYGCIKCGIVKNSDSQRKTNDEFIKQSIEVHGDKYDYSKVNYINNHTEVIIICKEHGEFKQQPCVHMNMKCGCNKCSLKYQPNTYESIIKANLIHCDKYDYSKVNYINCKEKVIIICKEHGEFEQTMDQHINKKAGCSKCGIIKATDLIRKPKDEMITNAMLIHGDKYDYSKVNYINCKEKVTIICKKHGKFEQTMDQHIHKKAGCSKCNPNHSKIQIQWLNLISTLQNIDIQHAENSCEYTIPNTRFRADGYCQETNTIYEFHGDYWHGNPLLFKPSNMNKTTHCTFGELYQKTLDKEDLIKSLGYNLVVMWEYDWIKMNKCIKRIQQKFKNKN
jgi:hypothetical protein